MWVSARELDLRAVTAIGPRGAITSRLARPAVHAPRVHTTPFSRALRAALGSDDGAHIATDLCTW